MKLRYLGHPNRYTEFKVGRYYDVVEILEMPGHVMARLANRHWPKPGAPFFGFHPESFAPSLHGLPAYSCGYTLIEDTYFGVIVPNSVYPTPRPGLLRANRAADNVSEVVDKMKLRGLWWVSYHRVLTSACYPKTLESSFMAIGFNHDFLGRDVSYRVASAAIRKVVRQLGISENKMPKVEDQELEVWMRSRSPAGPLNWPS